MYYTKNNHNKFWLINLLAMMIVVISVSHAAGLTVYNGPHDVIWNDTFVSITTKPGYPLNIECYVGYVLISGHPVKDDEYDRYLTCNEVRILDICGSSNDNINLSGLSDEFSNLSDQITIKLHEGVNVVVGSNKNEKIIDNANANNTISSGGGIDEITVGSGNNIINAGDGIDRITTNGGTNIIDGGNDKDIITVQGGGNSTVIGAAGDDTIFHDHGTRVIQVGYGDDEAALIPLPSDETAKTDIRESADEFTYIDEGGNDTLNFTDAAQGITLDLDMQNEWQTVDEVGTKMKIEGQFENLSGSGFNDAITVDPLDITRILDGGAGRDTLSVDGMNSPVTRSAGKIEVSGYQAINHSNFENVQISNAGALNTVLYDITGDGRPDVLYRHPDSGKVGVWIMDGYSEHSWAYMGNHGAAWDIRGVGDFNGDGYNDVVYRNTGGMVGVWLMNGVTENIWLPLGNHGVAWDVKGVGDFNSDGFADVLYRSANGMVGVWLMNGAAENTWQPIGNHGDAWEVNGVGDFNNDGSVDVVYRNTNGLVGVWLMNGVTENTWQPIGNHGAAWEPKCVADYNNDGSVDVIYRNTNGTVGVWLMDGVTENTWQRIGNHGAWDVR